MRDVATLVVFLLTVGAVVMRPARLPEWLVALAGVAAMVAIGAESATEAIRAVAAQWDVLLFFAGLMTIIAIAEAAGFFSWVAFISARAARLSARRLFVSIMAACAAITIVMTNDAAALIMTPLVFSLAARLRLRPLPFAFACTFVANGASLVLPISNPVNVMIADAARLTLGRYLSLLWLPSLAGVAVTAAILWLVIGRTLRRRFEASLVSPPEGDPGHRTEVTLLLLAAAGSMIAVAATGGPVGVGACAAAGVMFAHGAVRGRLDISRIASDANPTIVLLVAALFALTEGVVRSGLLAAPLAALEGLTQMHAGQTAAAAALASAVGSNLFNNLPTAALASAVLRHAPLSIAVGHRIAAGAIVGCDLGPNLTTVGSLSTLLWLVLLRRRGLEVSPLDYLKLGAVVAPATLAIAILALLVTAR